MGIAIRGGEEWCRITAAASANRHAFSAFFADRIPVRVSSVSARRAVAVIVPKACGGNAIFVNSLRFRYHGVSGIHQQVLDLVHRSRRQRRAPSGLSVK